MTPVTGERSRWMPRLVSVIIPVHNAEALLPLQLGALERQTYSGAWELVVADNGSTDKSVDAAKAWIGKVPDMRIVDASTRPGVNCARNTGAQAARGDFLLYCDADDEASPQWLEAMAKAAPSFDLVGGRVDPAALNDPVTLAWRWPHPQDRLNTALGFLPYSEGCTFGIWTDVLRDLGGWDEGYDRGGDEIELCWRAQLSGYSIGYAIDGVMRYRHRKRLGAMTRQIYRYGMGDTRLYRDFRGRGVPPAGFRTHLREWKWLVSRASHLFKSRESRGEWICTAAYWAGRATGSIYYRAFR